MKKGDRLADQEWLLRRGWFPSNKHIRKDYSIADTAFQPSRNDDLKLSVNIERLTTYEKTILNPQNFRICKVQALDAHQLKLECIYDPLEATEKTDKNLVHALICGFEQDDLRVPGLLARRAIMVNYP